METFDLVRSYLPDRTIGHFNGLVTLERPWLQNKVNESCIPEGLYRCLRDKMGRFQYFRLVGVPGRTGIEFHGGVRPAHSKGCILVGESFTRTYDLTGSVAALDDMLMFTHESDFMLNIRAFNPAIDHDLIRA